MVDIIFLLKDLFIDKIDYTLTYIAMTILLFFYGVSITRSFVKKSAGTKAHKFIFFALLVIFGVNLGLAFLINLVLGLTDSKIKWGVIAFLLVWSFIKFDREILRENKQGLFSKK